MATQLLFPFEEPNYKKIIREMHENNMTRQEMLDVLGWSIQKLRNFMKTHKVSRADCGMNSRDHLKDRSYKTPVGINGWPMITHGSDAARVKLYGTRRYEDVILKSQASNFAMMPMPMPTHVYREASC